MIRLFSLTILLLQISTPSFAITYPFQPTPVNEYSRNNQDLSKSTRLRLAVTVEGSAPDDNVKIGDLIVCSSSACYRPKLKKFGNYISLSQTNDGGANVLFDVSLPVSDINEVYFENVPGEKIVYGKINVPSPSAELKNFQGEDILVVLKKTSDKSQVIYKPSRAVSELLDDEAKVVYYNPAYRTTVNLPFNVKLTIPEGALKNPQIFSVAVRDTDNKYPSIDIFPVLEMAKEFTVAIDSTNTVKGARAAKEGLQVPQTPPLDSVNNVRGTVNSSGQSNTIKSFTKTGLMKFSQFGEQSDKRLGALAASADVCGATIAANTTIINNLMPQVGVVNVNWCENMEPYIHIFVVNRNDARVAFSLPSHWQAGDSFYLYPINDVSYLGASIVNVNGFYWYGDEGTGPNQVGESAGYVAAGGAPYSFNRNSTNNQGDGNKYVFMSMKTGNGSRWELRNEVYFYYNWDVVISSSTSIVKDGVCTTDSLVNRWSAIGESNGTMMIISSTSDGQTSASQLCSVFKSLGIQNAIRLDGGPSAGVTSGGVLKNPLTGLARLKYGSVRYVAYPLQVGVKQ